MASDLFPNVTKSCEIGVVVGVNDKMASDLFPNVTKFCEIALLLV